MLHLSFHIPVFSFMIFVMKMLLQEFITCSFPFYWVQNERWLKVCFCGIALESGRVDGCEKNKLFPKPFASNNLKVPRKVLQQKQRLLTVLAVLCWLSSHFPTILLKWGTQNQAQSFQVPVMVCPACDLCRVQCHILASIVDSSPSQQCCYSTNWSPASAATTGCSAPRAELRTSPWWTTWCLCWPKSQISRVHLVSSSVIHVSHSL